MKCNKIQNTKYKIQLNPFYSARQERVSAQAKGEAGVTLLQYNNI